jgi:hypothetical protein
MQKTITAYCTSGLGNRICTLIGALYWSERLDRKLQIVWPIDNECMCSYDELFSTYTECLVRADTIYTCNNSCAVVGFTYQTSYVRQEINKVKDIITNEVNRAFNNLIDPNSIHLIDDLTKYEHIIYNNVEVPSYISSVDDILKRFAIQQHIISKFKKFINNKKIDESVTGVMIRKTDRPNFYNYRSDEYYSILFKNNQRQFFITSDCKQTESLYRKYKNVLCYPKTAFVQFNVHTGRVERSKQSVIEAFICLLVLSKTTIHDQFYSQSTFLKVASYYKDTDI